MVNQINHLMGIRPEVVQSVVASFGIHELPISEPNPAVFQDAWIWIVKYAK